LLHHDPDPPFGAAAAYATIANRAVPNMPICAHEKRMASRRNRAYSR
jgi:hypothetical protein